MPFANSTGCRRHRQNYRPMPNQTLQQTRTSRAAELNVERRENAPLNGELLRQRLLGRREIAPPNNPLERLAA